MDREAKGSKGVYSVSLVTSGVAGLRGCWGTAAKQAVGVGFAAPTPSETSTE